MTFHTDWVMTFGKWELSRKQSWQLLSAHVNTASVAKQLHEWNVLTSQTKSISVSLTSVQSLLLSSDTRISFMLQTLWGWVVITSLNSFLLCLLQEPFAGVPWVLSAFRVQSHDAAKTCNGWWHICLLPRLCRSVPCFSLGVMLSMLLKTARKLLGFGGLNFCPWQLTLGLGRQCCWQGDGWAVPPLSGLGCWTSGDVFPSHALRSAEVSLPCRMVHVGYRSLSALGGRVMLSARLGWRNKDGSFRVQIQPCSTAFF